MQKVIKEFLSFLPHIKIRSKDKGIIPFNNLWNGQKQILREIASCNDAQRTIVILKARQLGITTLLSVFDLFYIMKLAGVKGAILFASYKDAYRIRYDLTTLYETLPTHKRQLMTGNNREAIRFANTSELYFLYTSNRTGAKGMAGRGNSFNYLHASEVAFFKSWDDFDAIQSSLSDSFKYRLYVYESTANGYNEFFDLWETAKKSSTMKAIFVGWWSKNDNVLPKKLEYANYFRPLDNEEKAYVKKIKQYYNIDITTEQWAWWRYQLETKFRNNEVICLQELPHTEDEAFQLSGSKYFPSVLIQNQFIEANKYNPMRFHAWVEGNEIRLTLSDMYNLLIWELPQVSVKYVIGADPTFGANPDSDNAVISVFKCEKEQMIQVAEFCDNQVPPQLLARMILFLAGFYNGALVNMEVNGPGKVALYELDQIKKNPHLLKVNVLGNTLMAMDKLEESIKQMREYLYFRPDSLSKSFVRHWITTGDTKAWIFEQLRGALYDKSIVILSTDGLQEMQNIVRDGSVIEAGAGWHDDRVITYALAYEAYSKYIRHTLNQQSKTNNKQTIKAINPVEELAKLLAKRALSN